MVDYHIVNCCRFDLGHDILMVQMKVVLLMLLQPDVARTILLVVLESVALQTGHPVEDCWIVMLMALRLPQSVLGNGYRGWQRSGLLRLGPTLHFKL